MAIAIAIGITLLLILIAAWVTPKTYVPGPNKLSPRWTILNVIFSYSAVLTLLRWLHFSDLWRPILACVLSVIWLKAFEAVWASARMARAERERIERETERIEGLKR